MTMQMDGRWAHVQRCWVSARGSDGVGLTGIAGARTRRFIAWAAYPRVGVVTWGDEWRLRSGDGLRAPACGGSHGAGARSGRELGAVVDIAGHTPEAQGGVMRPYSSCVRERRDASTDTCDALVPVLRASRYAGLSDCVRQ